MEQVDTRYFSQTLRKAIAEFNRGFYFEAHDILEELWMETRGNDRPFLQGLIQIAVGFYHFFNDNFRGATSQFTKGLLKLENFLPEHRGVELENFTAEVGEWNSMAKAALGRDRKVSEPLRAPRIQLTQT